MIKIRYVYVLAL